MPNRTDEANIQVQCPTCTELIGLANDELYLPVLVGNVFASFVCHVCQTGWRITPEYESFKTD